MYNYFSIHNIFFYLKSFLLVIMFILNEQTSAIRYLLFVLHECTHIVLCLEVAMCVCVLFSKPRGCNVSAHIFLSLEAATLVRVFF